MTSYLQRDVLISYSALKRARLCTAGRRDAEAGHPRPPVLDSPTPRLHGLFYSSSPKWRADLKRQLGVGENIGLFLET